jgi:hypothetical protein
MSVSGLLVKARRTFPLGSLLQMKLHLTAGADPVTRMGSVVRITPGNQMGIDMRRLRPTEDDVLQEFLLPLISEGS